MLSQGLRYRELLGDIRLLSTPTLNKSGDTAALVRKEAPRTRYGFAPRDLRLSGRR
jgi:hypothetical protein